jgi:hypothetical protein
MPRVSISLSEEEITALRELSRRCLRYPEDQAKLIIINTLDQFGLLKSETERADSNGTEQPEQPGQPG